jgi:hypothetical protein
MTRWSRGFETLSKLLADPHTRIPDDAPPDPRGIFPVRDRHLEIPPNVHGEPRHFGRQPAKRQTKSSRNG